MKCRQAFYSGGDLNTKLCTWDNDEPGPWLHDDTGGYAGIAFEKRFLPLDQFIPSIHQPHVGPVHRQTGISV